MGDGGKTAELPTMIANRLQSSAFLGVAMILLGQSSIFSLLCVRDGECKGENAKP